MAVLIKCNATDLVPGDELTFTLPKQRGVGLTQGLEAFVWISENPREGPKGVGLEMRGEVTSWEPADRERTTVTIRVNERLSSGVSMDALARMARQSEVVMGLHRRIASFRHPRIWGLLPAERQVLLNHFEASCS
jgi:hypothetical protein